jgi:hypothetical protein
MRHLASNLTEGMREGDLADLVLPLISVDEYKSKIDEDEAIVIGFYVHDQAAADDLNRYLQKSAAPLLDTEVSPAPDQHGYYLVFVELTKNSRLAENITDIINEMEGLVDIEEWQMRVRDHDDLIPFSPEALSHVLKHFDDHMREQAILKFLGHSLLESANIDGDLLVLEAGSERMVFNVVGFDQVDRLLHAHRLDEAALAYDLRAVARTNRINRMLGEAWNVMALRQYTLLHHDEDGLLLR